MLVSNKRLPVDEGLSWWHVASTSGDPCPCCNANAVRIRTVEDWTGTFGLKEEHRCNRCRTSWLEDVTDPIKAGIPDATTLACPKATESWLTRWNEAQIRTRGISYA